MPLDGAYGATKHALQGIVESLYYELKPYNVQIKSMIPGSTKTNFQIPLIYDKGYKDVKKQRKVLLDGNKDISEATEAAEII